MNITNVEGKTFLFLCNTIYFLFTVAVPQCYVLATGSKAANKQPKSIGLYQLLTEKTNDFPAWKLTADDITRYLYRYANGHWHIGSSLGEKVRSIKSETPSDSPFTPGLNWMYWDGSNMVVDDSLHVSRFAG